MPNTKRIIIEVGMTDMDGNEFPHPQYWDWDDLVGDARYIGEA